MLSHLPRLARSQLTKRCQIADFFTDRRWVAQGVTDRKVVFQVCPVVNLKTHKSDTKMKRKGGTGVSEGAQGTDFVSRKNSKGIMINNSLSNKAFEEFYRAQDICPGGEKEFEDFLAACQRGLPSVFRVLKIRPENRLLIDKLRVGKDRQLELVKWHPEDRVWKVGRHTRWDLTDKAELARLHQLIDNLRLVGAIYRQEQVSMAPVLCLDVKPHHAVLDMCSSPGSKTGQVIEAFLEAVGGDDKATSQLAFSQNGFVVANEPDLERCFNLTGNMKLLGSPNLIITSYDGQSFPELYGPDGKEVRYDRIVCDVPCSGDGTIRKNPNIWESWHPGRGNNRHFIQYNIAKRGVELMKVGGLMAYSSCSINQIENECVMARLLKEAEGSLELVDQTDKLPGLNWYPGLSDWRVIDRNMKEYKSYEDVPPELKCEIAPGMFPPPEDVARNLHLERCMRFLPHSNDDGGFFVAILRKTRDLPENWVTASERNSSDQSTVLIEPEEELKPGVNTRIKKMKPQLVHLLFNASGYSFIENIPEVRKAAEDSLAYWGCEESIKTSNLVMRNDPQKVANEVTNDNGDGALLPFTIFYFNDRLAAILKNPQNKNFKMTDLGNRLLRNDRRRTAKVPYNLTSCGLQAVIPSADSILKDGEELGVDFELKTVEMSMKFFKENINFSACDEVGGILFERSSAESFLWRDDQLMGQCQVAVKVNLPESENSPGPSDNAVLLRFPAFLSAHKLQMDINKQQLNYIKFLFDL